MALEPKFQKSHEYINLLKRILRRRSSIAWVIMSVIALSVAVLTRIPILSVFAVLPPMIGLCFLLVILVILINPENRETETGIPGLTDSLLSIVLLIAVIGIVVSFQLGSFYMSNLIQFGFFLFIPLVVILFSTKVDRTRLGFSLGKRGNLSWTLIISVLYGLLVWFLIGAPNFYKLAIMNPPSLWIQFIPFALVIATVLILIAVAIPEEFLFRAVLQPAMTERFGRVSGILLSSLIFGLFHLPANFMMFLILIPNWVIAVIGSLLMSLLFQAQIGLVLGVAYDWTKSLVMPVSLHAIHDIIEMLPFFIYLIMGSIIIL